MQITAHVMSADTQPFVQIKHNNEELMFNISVFGKRNFQGEQEGTLNYINDYWNQLPIERQNKIFDIYKAIDHGFENNFRKDDLTSYTTGLVAELMNAIDYNNVLYWVQHKANIKISEAFTVDYEHSFDNNTSREKTYTRTDYIKLVSLSVMIRAMIPIWGEYISLQRRAVGNLYKEANAFRLLSSSSVMLSEPMQKLGTYIENIVGDKKYDPNNIHDGITSEDFCHWELSKICVRKLTVGIIENINPGTHLVSGVFKDLFRDLQGRDMNSEETYREKKGKDEEKNANGFGDKISTLERYRFKFRISPGEIAELEHSMRDINEAVHHITYQVTPEELYLSLRTVIDRPHNELMQPQINLLRWIFSPAISPRGMMFMQIPTILQALGACEAILWKMGYKYLAVLMSSYAILDERSATMRVSPTDSKMQIPSELMHKLDVLFPFHRTMKVKKNEINNGDNKIVNMTAKTINDTADNFRMFSWAPTCSEDKLMELFGTNSRRTPIRPDIKIEIAKLIVDIGERKWY